MSVGVTRVQTVIVASILVIAVLGSVVVYNEIQSGHQKPPTGSVSGGGTTYSGSIVGSFQAQNVIAASDVSPNYTFTVTSIGNVPPSVQIEAVAPKGISVNFNPSNVSITQGQPSVVNAEVVVLNSTSPGTYNINVKFVNGAFVQTENLSVEVVKYLVVTVGESFIPKNITVPVGSTVIWYRLNGVLSQYDSGVHNVVFTNGMASSPPLQQYQSWSYQFNQAGVYNYECTYHLPFMVGVVNVVP